MTYSTSETTFSNKVTFAIYYTCNLLISFGATLLAKLGAEPDRQGLNPLGSGPLQTWISSVSLSVSSVSVLSQSPAVANSSTLLLWYR